MTRNQNHDADASSSSSSSSSRKRFRGFDNDGVALNHDVLFIVMMKLGVVDFVAFSGVCKSWRSLAFSNWNMFMASKPPMSICISDEWCSLEDLEGKKFKTIIPHSAGRICFGLTCGYLILFSRETRDFWLVNPITRHELHFPNYPIDVEDAYGRIRAILFFSPSTSGWMFVVLHRLSRPKLSFSIAGKQGWNHVDPTVPIPPILDLHAFKGKIYTHHADSSVCELRLNPNRKDKWTLLESKNFPKLDLPFPELVSSIEKLYMIYWSSSSPKKVMELDFGEMKWVPPKKTIREYTFFLGAKKSSVAFKPESWIGPPIQYKRYGHFQSWTSPPTQYKSYWHFLAGQNVVFSKGMWYFPHDCLKVNLLDGW
ncbi:unnamed protein product [Lactuca virosa]|uniref:F-box domain-containing protein n=1 Tax=Lactuca virosa TaxID=75947 RepID=A0AAU9PFE0_9ASTR|nr:unnamed protein product [Lactuca virosa]